MKEKEEKQEQEQEKKQEDKYKIEKRFGKEVAEAGFAATPNIILKHAGQLGVTTSEVCLVVQVLSFQWDERKPYPSCRMLGERMGIHRVNVQRLASSLIEKKLLQRGGKEWQVTAWDFSPLIQKCMAIEKQIAPTEIAPTEKQIAEGQTQETQEDESEGAEKDVGVLEW